MKSLFSFIVLIALLSILVLFTGTGCKSVSKTAQVVSGDLGDKATSGTALVSITKVTGSDALANGSPTGKSVTIIGNLKGIPIKGKDGDIVKDYGEYRYTESPAWYDKDNVTKETVIVFTGDNVKELKKYLLNKMNKTPANKSKDAVSEETPSAPD